MLLCQILYYLIDSLVTQNGILNELRTSRNLSGLFRKLFL